MPSFYSTIELLASVENAIIVFLVMYGPCQTVPKHALGQGREGVNWILSKECRCGGVVPFRKGCIRIGGWCLELEEFVFSWDVLAGLDIHDHLEEHASSHCTITLLVQLVDRSLKKTSRACAYRLS